MHTCSRPTTLYLIFVLFLQKSNSLHLSVMNRVLSRYQHYLYQSRSTSLCMLSSSEGSSIHSRQQLVIPRAAVSVVVMCKTDNEVNRYVLVQRGKEPNKGMWSLPGGKIEVGETSLAAVKRELWEETGLGHREKDQDDFILNWCEDGPVCITDSIHKSDELVQYHYVISQWFVEATPKNGESFVSLPTLIASDDAADAKWWDLKSIKEGIDRGEVTQGVEKVILRTELMYEKGLLS